MKTKYIQPDFIDLSDKFYRKTEGNMKEIIANRKLSRKLVYIGLKY